MNRRQFVASGLAGIGIVAANASHASNGGRAQDAAAAAGTPDHNTTVAGSDEAPAIQPSGLHAASFTAMLAPVVVGSTLEGARVASIDVDEWGRGTAEVVVEDDSYHIDVCVKDASLGHEPVASTERFDLFVRNGGDGSVATPMNVGGAVAALAGAIRANEANAEVALVSKSEYWARGC